MFDDIIGNEKIKQQLKQAVDFKKTSHSYLFLGISGIGKKMIAKEFAKMILCMDEQKYCNHCKSCLEFDSGNNPDFQEIEPDGASIKIEQIRAIQKKILEAPIISNRKVYIIDEADLMTVEPIELYSQVVSGVNYKVIFATQAYANTRNDVQLHEYVFYKPLNFEENSVAELENVGSIKHFQSNGVSVNSPRYSQINAAISSYLMGSRNKLVSVNNVNAI